MVLFHFLIFPFEMLCLRCFSQLLLSKSYFSFCLSQRCGPGAITANMAIINIDSCLCIIKFLCTQIALDPNQRCDAGSHCKLACFFSFHRFWITRSPEPTATGAAAVPEDQGGRQPGVLPLHHCFPVPVLPEGDWSCPPASGTEGPHLPGSCCVRFLYRSFPHGEKICPAWIIALCRNSLYTGLKTSPCRRPEHQVETWDK